MIPRNNFDGTCIVHTHTLIELKKIAQILYLCSKGFLTQVSKNIYYKYFNETRCRLPGYMSKVNKNRNIINEHNNVPFNLK